MPDIQLSKGYCNDCESSVLAVREAPNHALWLLISIVSLGIGIIGWIIVGLRPVVWRCAQCGTEQMP